jgi:DNA-binding transcriptional LysR family regulator
MELYQLRAFITVAETGRLTRAAERLHLSQPALSAQIKALEDSLDQQLFERGSTGMALTRMGRELLPLAQRVLAAADSLKRAAHAHRTEIAGKVSLGTLSDPHFIRLGEFLGRALERYPLIEVELRNEFTGAAFDAVRAGELDASFYFGEITDPAVTGVRLSEMTYCVAAPAAWADRVRDASWAEIAQMPWILTPETSTHNRLVHALLREHGVEPLKVIGADNEGVIANLVESEVGVSLVREDLALDRDGAIYTRPGACIPTALWFIHLAERVQEPILAALLGVLRETWRIEATPRREWGAAPKPAPIRHPA